jgi:triacylglycerol lipase
MEDLKVSSGFRMRKLVSKIMLYFLTGLVCSLFFVFILQSFGFIKDATPFVNRIISIFLVLAFIEVFRRIRPFLPSNIQRPANIIRSFFVEFFSYFFLFNHTYITKRMKNQSKENAFHQTAVLLIHGFMGGSSNWDYIHYRLNEAKCGPIYTINLMNPFDSIMNYAVQVQKKIEAIKKRTGCNEVILIGFSMGGLVGAYYAAYLASQNDKKEIITIGTPHHGTKLALIGFCPCVKEFQFESNFLQELNEKLSKDSSISFYNIFSIADQMVLPNRSAQLELGTPHYIFQDIGHISLLFSDRVADQLIRIVKMKIVNQLYESD